MDSWTYRQSDMRKGWEGVRIQVHFIQTLRGRQDAQTNGRVEGWTDRGDAWEGEKRE